MSAMRRIANENHRRRSITHGNRERAPLLPGTPPTRIATALRLSLPNEFRRLFSTSSVGNFSSEETLRKRLPRISNREIPRLETTLTCPGSTRTPFRRAEKSQIANQLFWHATRACGSDRHPISDRRKIGTLLRAISFFRIRFLWLASLLVCVSFASAATDLTSGYPVPEDGRVKNGVYTNEYFGLRYPLPTNWTEDLSGPEPSVSGYYSLAALKPAGILDATILIAAQDNFFSPEPAASAKEFLAQMKQHLDSSLSAPAAPSELKIAGRTFARLDYEGAGLHHAVVVTELRCHSVIFSLTSNRLQQIEILAASLNKISFAAAGDARWPVCVKDYAVPTNILDRVNPELTGPRYASVPVRLIVGANGKVAHVHTIAGFPEQKKSVAAALAQWEFRSYLVNGNAVEVETGLLFEFRQKQP